MELRLPACEAQTPCSARPQRCTLGVKCQPNAAMAAVHMRQLGARALITSERVWLEKARPRLRKSNRYMNRMENMTVDYSSFFCALFFHLLSQKAHC